MRTPHRSGERPPRVLLLATGMRMFDDQMPSSFVPGLHERARSLAALLRRAGFELIETGLVRDLEEAAAARDVTAEADPDTVIVAPVMATPPALVSTALGGTGTPTVLWWPSPVAHLAGDLDQARAHEDTTLTGAVMAAGALAERRPRPVVVMAPAGDAPAIRRLHRALIATSAAGRLRRSRVLAVGEPITGYTRLQPTAAQLDALGISVIRQAHLPVETSPRAVLDAMAGCGWPVHEASDASTALAGRILSAAREIDADGITLNCHGPAFRENPDVGIVACLGASLCSTLATPTACTGDIPTTLLLMLTRWVAGASLYCEMYAATDGGRRVLLANGGEGDTAMADGPVTIQPTEHYPGRRGSGDAVGFPVRVGTATLCALTPMGDGWHLQTMVGTVTPERFPEMRAPAAVLDLGPSGAARLEAWITRGPAHHHALVPGDITDQMAVACTVLDIAHDQIT